MKCVFLTARFTAEFSTFGMWRSLVAHLHGVQGVAGSNPVIPTQKPPTVMLVVFLWLLDQNSERVGAFNQFVQGFCGV